MCCEKKLVDCSHVWSRLGSVVGVRVSIQHCSDVLGVVRSFCWLSCGFAGCPVACLDFSFLFSEMAGSGFEG